MVIQSKIGKLRKNVKRFREQDQEETAQLETKLSIAKTSGDILFAQTLKKDLSRVKNKSESALPASQTVNGAKTAFGRDRMVKVKNKRLNSVFLTSGGKRISQ